MVLDAEGGGKRGEGRGAGSEEGGRVGEGRGLRKGKRGRVKEWKKGKSRWNKARVGRGREKTGEGGGGNESDCSELSQRSVRPSAGTRPAFRCTKF